MKYWLSSAKISVIVSAALLINLSSCTETKKPDDGPTAVTVPESLVTTQPVAESIIKSGPSPSEIPAMLQATGAVYDKSLVNSPDKAASYSTPTSKAALNLGIYATDAAYLVAYGKGDEAGKSLAAISKLGQSLGISGAFETILKARVEKNLSNHDSLSKITDDGLNLADQFLKQNQQNASAALVATGLFVEGLYISTSLIHKYPHDLPDASRDIVLLPLVRTVMEQKTRLLALLTLLESVKSDKDAAKAYDEIKGIEAKFELLNLDEKIKNNKGGEILKDASLKDIAKAVSDLRSSYVK